MCIDAAVRYKYALTLHVQIRKDAYEGFNVHQVQAKNIHINAMEGISSIPNGLIGFALLEGSPKVTAAMEAIETVVDTSPAESVTTRVRTVGEGEIVGRAEILVNAVFCANKAL